MTPAGRQQRRKVDRLPSVKRSNSKKGKRPPHPGEPERITARRVKALELRKTGMHYRAIAAACGVSVETAYADVQAELRALRDATVKTAEEVKELELRRCDQLLRDLHSKKGNKGQARVATAIVRVMERRAKLLGLDAPTKVAPVTPDGNQAYTPLSSVATELLEKALEAEGEKR